jgi:hypothetical protein
MNKLKAPQRMNFLLKSVKNPELQNKFQNNCISTTKIMKEYKSKKK